MSKEAVAEIIGKAILDIEFRDQLFADPGKILSGYDLNEQEQTEFRELKRDAFEAFASTLDERVSQASLLMNFAQDQRSILTAASFGVARG